MLPEITEISHRSDVFELFFSFSETESESHPECCLRSFIVECVDVSLLHPSSLNSDMSHILTVEHCWKSISLLIIFIHARIFQELGTGEL